MTHHVAAFLLRILIHFLISSKESVHLVNAFHLISTWSLVSIRSIEHMLLQSGSRDSVAAKKIVSDWDQICKTHFNIRTSMGSIAHVISKDRLKISK